MPVKVQFDNTYGNPIQAAIIPDGTFFNDGIMTKEMVIILNSLQTGPGRWNVTDVKIANYAAAVNDLVQIDVSGGPIQITLPKATSANKGMLIGTKSVTPAASSAVTVVGTGGDLVEGAASYQANGTGFVQEGTIFISDGATGWWVWANYKLAAG